ncbi:methionine ABC transporter substrate-binding protein [Clostridium thermosuccinogenes]|jgi:D-methionine transport system substrate-binding protein|uniref:Lipoprotein n=1 Tax=Clostridium thermosuccinogenes TaxID=84032 RepID=A0A2K2FFM3_9CLOT|nr:MetQ/NlpA family ABC transporter substrate-binding protein [Pseudoclostridium thermosuccinogenes]AUS96664.1 methionine ABC transporter substrate-binding protein [Pseudoclostridium thermosuccinogenes]PNT92676.1 methionine ABC transporter substrate-binding protein [Pseudoclostridium thermosuccinogenes]PNT97580.1 methionine ABC transporter substrate-binding protein [Pseudoclostridium thermosuccinogenes]PNT99576.1 methionine ABC transporter substrate-binding protein [Pseudoclostridium thermosucc
MKKILVALSIIMAISVFAFSGCTSGNSGKKTKLVVGASPTPHALILKEIQPILEEKGIELEIKEMTDYVTPNTALNDKQLDANFFQHTPYMENFAKENNMELVVAAEVHIEPMGAYSEKIKSVDELQDGAIVAIPNDPTNEGRALILLQKQGLIKLKDEDELIQTPKDIVENPKNLQFKELEAAQLPRVLPDVDLAVINTNYALDGGLDPIKDSIFMEDKDSPFPNVLVVRPDNKDDPAIKELAKALNSETVRKFLKENFGDSTIPAF